MNSTDTPIVQVDMNGEELTPGTVVTGPFYSDGRWGVGIVTKPGRPIWTRVGEGYIPVKVTKGDRATGGYRPDSLMVLR